LYDWYALSGAKVSFTQGHMSNPIQLEARLQLLSVPPYTVFSVEGAVESILGYSPNSFLQGEVTFPSLTHTDDQDVLEAMLHSQPQLHSAQSQTHVLQPAGASGERSHPVSGCPNMTTRI
jgi:hypothetical protein